MNHREYVEIICTLHTGRYYVLTIIVCTSNSPCPMSHSPVPFKNNHASRSNAVNAWIPCRKYDKSDGRQKTISYYHTIYVVATAPRCIRPWQPNSNILSIRVRNIESERQKGTITFGSRDPFGFSIRALVVQHGEGMVIFGDSGKTMESYGYSR